MARGAWRRAVERTGVGLVLLILLGARLTFLVPGPQVVREDT